MCGKLFPAVIASKKEKLIWYENQSKSFKVISSLKYILIHNNLAKSTGVSILFPGFWKDQRPNEDSYIGQGKIRGKSSCIELQKVLQKCAEHPK